MSAPTTTSPSRSACASSPRACARCSAAGAARSTRRAVYRGEHLIADFDAVSVHVDGEPVRLTRREFELLSYLVENRNRVLSRDRLLERVWGYDRLIETRSVDVHVGRLRSKLAAPATRSKPSSGSAIASSSDAGLKAGDQAGLKAGPSLF